MMPEALFKNEASFLRQRCVEWYLRRPGRFDGHFTGVTDIAAWVAMQSAVEVPDSDRWVQCLERIHERGLPVWRETIGDFGSTPWPQLLSQYCVPVDAEMAEDASGKLALREDSSLPMVCLMRTLSKAHNAYRIGTGYLVAYYECIVAFDENDGSFGAVDSRIEILKAVFASWESARVSEKWLAARLLLSGWMERVLEAFSVEAAAYFGTAVAIADDETGGTVHADRVLVYEVVADDCFGRIYPDTAFMDSKIRKPKHELLVCMNIDFDFPDFFARAMRSEKFAHPRDEEIACALRRKGKFLGFFKDGVVFAVQPRYCPEGLTQPGRQLLANGMIEV